MRRTNEDPKEKSNRVLVLILCLAFLLFARIFSCKGQALTIKDLPKLLKQSETDSILKIERLAALKFHKLINEFRIRNHKQPLDWSDVLWLAARNHDVWMWTNDVIGHEEDLGTKYFNGEDTKDRIRYVLKNKGKYYAGENAYCTYQVLGKNINEISENIAKDSFKAWNESKDHNENMLENDYTTHAVAFRITGIGLKKWEHAAWATDVFLTNYSQSVAKQ